MSYSNDGLLVGFSSNFLCILHKRVSSLGKGPSLLVNIFIKLLSKKCCHLPAACIVAYSSSVIINKGASAPWGAPRSFQGCLRILCNVSIVRCTIMIHWITLFSMLNVKQCLKNLNCGSLFEFFVTEKLLYFFIVKK